MIISSKDESPSIIIIFHTAHNNKLVYEVIMLNDHDTIKKDAILYQTKKYINFDNENRRLSIPRAILNLIYIFGYRF